MLTIQGSDGLYTYHLLSAEVLAKTVIENNAKLEHLIKSYEHAINLVVFIAKQAE